MKTRIITALVLLPLLVILLLSNEYVIAAAVTVVAIMALYEFYKATGMTQHKALCALGFAGAIPVALHSYIPVNTYFILFYIFMILLFSVMLKSHKTVTVNDAAMILFSLLYIPLFLSTLIGIKQLENGTLCLWLVFIGAFATDTFAYFTGVFLGKHKLCPEISPKKTIEGSIGGTLGCMALMLLYGLLMNRVFDVAVNYIALGILGVLCAVISQIGDLTASIIKRKFGVKDYGSLFPGHGGILDRLDSVIAVSPLVFIYITAFGI